MDFEIVNTAVLILWISPSFFLLMLSIPVVMGGYKHSYALDRPPIVIYYCVIVFTVVNIIMVSTELYYLAIKLFKVMSI
jgi:hypothetical protein